MANAGNPPREEGLGGHDHRGGQNRTGHELDGGQSSAQPPRQQTEWPVANQWANALDSANRFTLSPISNQVGGLALATSAPLPHDSQYHSASGTASQQLFNDPAPTSWMPAQPIHHPSSLKSPLDLTGHELGEVAPPTHHQNLRDVHLGWNVPSLPITSPVNTGSVAGPTLSTWPPNGPNITSPPSNPLSIPGWQHTGQHEANPSGSSATRLWSSGGALPRQYETSSGSTDGGYNHPSDWSFGDADPRSPQWTEGSSQQHSMVADTSPSTDQAQLYKGKRKSDSVQPITADDETIYEPDQGDDEIVSRLDKRRQQNKLAQRAFRARTKVMSAETTSQMVHLMEVNESQSMRLEEMTHLVARLQKENLNLKLAAINTRLPPDQQITDAGLDPSGSDASRKGGGPAHGH